MSNKSGPEFHEAAFRRVQRGVFAGMLGGLLVPPVCIALIARLLRAMNTPADPSTWLALAGLPLVAGIARTAAYRFFHPSTIDGSNPVNDRSLQLARAVLQNTLEQTVLFALAFHVLSSNIWAEAQAVPAAMAVWFVVARAAFAVSYARGAAARSFGFAATFYPSVLALVAGLLLPWL